MFRTTTSTAPLRSKEEGEPPESRFVVPQDYAERSPLQFEALYEASFPDHKFFGSLEEVRNVERQYREMNSQ
jgi:hypothetical protein